MIPWLGVSNSELGGQPHGSQSFWEWLGNTIVDIARFVWNGLVAGLTFMCDIGRAIIDFGLKVLCTIIYAWATAVKAAVDAIVDAFMAFVNWAIELANEIASAILSPIANAVQKAVTEYINNVRGACGMAELDFAKTGSATPSSQTAVLIALQGSLYWIIMGLAVLLEAILLLLSPVTLTFGFLIGMIISIIAAAIVQQVFCEMMPSTTNSIQEMTSCTSGDPTTSNAYDIAKKSGGGPDNQSERNTSEGRSWEIAYGIFGCLAAGFSSLFGYTSLVQGGIEHAFESAPMKKTRAILAVGAGAIGLLLSAMALPADSFSLGWFGMWGSILGVILGFSALGVGGDSDMLGWISIILGVVGVVLSSESLILSFNRGD